MEGVDIKRLVDHFGSISKAKIFVRDKLAEYYESKGIEILPKKEAVREYPEYARFFRNAPENAFLVHAKGKNLTFQACFVMKDLQKQMPFTVLVLEKNTSLLLTKGCYAIAALRGATHAGKTIAILKKGSELKRIAFHSWFGREKVISSTTALMESKARYLSTELLIHPAKINRYFLGIKGINNAENIDVDISDFYFLKGSNLRVVSKVQLPPRSRAVLRTRAVLKEADAEVISSLEGGRETKGLVECGGLLMDEKSTFASIPQIRAIGRSAELSHEAYTGSISEDALFYLKSKGIDEERAKELIIHGFLSPLIQWLPEELRREVERVASLAAL